MLTLAFDTATSVATVALADGEEVIGERVSRAAGVLADAHVLLAAAGREPKDIARLVVGTGPGSFTGIRVGLATAQGLALALDLPVAGVSTLDALAAGAPGAVPLIDARRAEVFALLGEPVCLRPSELRLGGGTVCVGDGAVRYRRLLEDRGVVVPADESELHLPRARFHALLACEFGPAELLEPLYLRIPDAQQAALA